jgi:hypothetical protein
MRELLRDAALPLLGAAWFGLLLFAPWVAVGILAASWAVGAGCCLRALLREDR